MSTPAGEPVRIHIGQLEPGSDRERRLIARVQRRQSRERRPRVPAGLDWQKYGVEPRWLGTDTSTCVVAVEPSFFHHYGRAELDRFFLATGSRGDLALVVAVIGDVDEDVHEGVDDDGSMSSWDNDVAVSMAYTLVSGRRLAAGVRPEIAPNLGPADRDLALRLLTRPGDAPWWTLRLVGAVTESRGIPDQVHHTPEGELVPILVDAAGEPVVAAWVSRSRDQRWYVIPDGFDWNNLVSWLVESALPEYVP